MPDTKEYPPVEGDQHYVHLTFANSDGSNKAKRVVLKHLNKFLMRIYSDLNIPQKQHLFENPRVRFQTIHPCLINYYLVEHDIKERMAGSRSSLDILASELTGSFTRKYGAKKKATGDYLHIPGDKITLRATQYIVTMPIEEGAQDIDITIDVVNYCKNSRLVAAIVDFNIPVPIISQNDLLIQELSQTFKVQNYSLLNHCTIGRYGINFNSKSLLGELYKLKGEDFYCKNGRISDHIQVS